jgi:hypothetical protein
LEVVFPFLLPFMAVFDKIMVISEGFMGDQLVLLQLDCLLDTTTRTHYFLWRRDGWLAHALFFSNWETQGEVEICSKDFIPLSRGEKKHEMNMGCLQD